MIELRKAKDRGHFDHGWLNTFHTFSFADYYDPAQMGFRALRVINEDRVSPGEGFGKHGHRDMEIISYPVSGVLSHRDSMGNTSSIQEGEIQYMSAGTGVTHSEFNGSNESTAHFLQIWIVPDKKGHPPCYGQNKFQKEKATNQLLLLASEKGENESVQIRQDVRIYTCTLTPQAAIEYKPRTGRYFWVQIVRGSLTLNQVQLELSDGAAISQESNLNFVGGESGAEFLLFDLS